MKTLLQKLNIFLGKKPRANYPGRDFFLQRLHVENITKDRTPYFMDLMTKQRVLHVGCTDWPIFDPDNNLHIKLARSGRLAALDGCDVDTEGLSTLKKHYPEGKYFDALESITDSYDWILVPEVIEHVPNIQHFMNALSRLDAARILITGPNVEGCESLGFFGKTYPNQVEEVHPDHNCWFSPYTLANSAKRYSGWDVERVFVINNRRSVGVVLRK